MGYTLLKNVNLLNGKKDMKVRKTSILIKDNIIDKIGDIEEAKDYKVVDLDGKYVIPGLINLHVHLPGSGKSAAPTSEGLKKLVNFIAKHKCLYPIGIALGATGAKQELLSGVTTLRSVGGVFKFDSMLRDQINSGKKIGPRIYSSDYAIATKDGHMAGTVSHEANNNEEAIAMVEDLAKSGADWIKIMITGGVLDAKVKGEPGILKMQPDMVKAVCDKAHELGFKVAAHVESYEGAKVAVENGVDTIEHGVKYDEALIKLMKEHNQNTVTTVSPALPICVDKSFDDFARYNSFVVFYNIVDGAKELIKNGMDIGLGNDTGCPYTTHYNFWRELEYVTKYVGVKPEQALYFATAYNAKILGTDDKIGTIEEGKFADMVVVDGNPLESFRTIQNPYVVIKDGVFYNQKIKKYKGVDEFLESINDIDLEAEFKKL